MRRLMMVPVGWPCTLRQCPPGHFVCDGQLCFKTEYAKNGDAGQSEAFNSAGEMLSGGEDVAVQPVEAQWVEDEADSFVPVQEASPPVATHRPEDDDHQSDRDLTSRTRSALRRVLGTGTAGGRSSTPLVPSEIAKKVTREKLKATKNCGVTSIAEISKWLAKYGLTLRD